MRFYSDELQKVFDTEKELIEAEAKVKAEAEAKAKKSKEKKDEAAKIEELFKVKNTAIKEFNEKYIGLRNEYNKAVRDARKDFDEKVAEITKVKDDAIAAYNSAVSEFIAKHPEGYHMTLRDGDIVTSFSGSGHNDLLNAYKDESEKFDELMNKLTKLLYV